MWSWRLIDCFAPTSAVRGFWNMASPVHWPNGFATLVDPNKGGIAVCDCNPLRDMAMRMREVPARPWVGVCVPLALVCTIFNAIYLSSITVFHDISKHIQQRARTGKIFARWHWAIAINSNKYFYTYTPQITGFRSLSHTSTSEIPALKFSSSVQKVPFWLEHPLKAIIGSMPRYKG